MRVLLVLLLLAPSTFAAQIRGVVQSPEGDPIAKAQVRAYRAEGTEAALARAAEGRDREPLATVESGEDGSFVLDPKGEGVFEIVAMRDGFMPAGAIEIAGTEETVVQLTPAILRTGRVTAGGKAVANARVIARSATSVVLTAQTDADGRFTMPDPKDCCVALIVTHPEYVTSVLQLATPRANRLEISLERGTAVSGKVVDASGKPVANATLMQDGWPIGRSGSDGAFAIQADPKKKVVAASGRLRASDRTGSKELVLTLGPSRSVIGSVRDAAKKPVPGAILWILSDVDAVGTQETVVANEKGEFEIAGLAAGDLTIWAFAGDELQFDPKEAGLARKETVRLDLVANRLSLVRGMVRDEDKRPIAGALVRLTSIQEPLFYVGSAGNRGFAVTGRDGRFRLAAPEMDGKLRVAALHPRFATAASDPFETEQGQAPAAVTITLPRGVKVDGIVVDGKDNPVGDAEVVLLQDSPGAMAWPLDIVMAQGRIAPFFRSGKDGTFTMRLNPVLHDVAVRKEGFAASRIGGFDPAAGKPLRVVLGPAVEIRGRVAATKLENAFVSARGADGSWLTAAVEPNGTFVVTSLSEGTYTLMLSAGALQSTKEVRAPATDVVLELPKSGELRGRVTDKATGAAIATEFTIEVSSDAEDAGFGVLEGNADGTFGGAVAPGAKSVTISAAGYLSQTAPVQIEVGKTAEISFALSRGRRIHGRVTTTDGRPLDKVRVTLGEESSFTTFDRDFEPQRGTDETGEYELTAAPTEAVRITAQRAGFQSVTVAVEAGESDRTIDIAMSSGRKAVGRVVDDRGAAVEGARVSATAVSSDSDSQSAETDAGGNFTIEGLGTGRHQFRASKPRLGSATVNDVDIGAGPVLITLRSAAASATIRGVVKGYAEGAWMMGIVTVTPVATGEDYRYASGQLGRDGKFRIEDAPSGDVHIQAQLMTMQRQISTPRVKISVPPGGEAEATLVIRTDVVVRGTITEGGVPAVGRRVTFSGTDGYASTTSGEGGAYEIAGLDPGAYDISVSAGRTSFETKKVISGSETFDIDVSFAAIHGRVLDEADAAVAGATVRADNGAEVTTDAAGGFSLRVSGSESRTVTASKAGHAHASATAQPNGPPVVLKLARSDGLRVRLIDARDGTTLNGYVVATDAQGAHIPSTYEEKRDGTVHVPVAHGAYRIAASADGYASQSVRTNVPLSGELRIALTPGGTLIVQADRESHDRVKLVLPNGEEYVRCHCNGIAEIRLTGQTTTIEHVASGTYAMQLLDAKGKVKTSYPVTVMEGGVTRAEIRVPSD